MFISNFSYDIRIQLFCNGYELKITQHSLYLEIFTDDVQ